MIRELRKRLQDELKVLEHELRHELPKEIKRALALGDLRENAEYHSALERQSYVKARMGQLTKRLGEIGSFNFDAIPRDRVGLGSKVTLLDLDTDTEVRYTLVMNDDGDIAQNRISIGSPIGRGLAGRKVGDEVAIQIPSGTRKFEVIDLETIHDQEKAAAAGNEAGAEKPVLEGSGSTTTASSSDGSPRSDDVSVLGSELEAAGEAAEGGGQDQNSEPRTSPEDLAGERPSKE